MQFWFFYGICWLSMAIHRNTCRRSISWWQQRKTNIQKIKVLDFFLADKIESKLLQNMSGLTLICFKCYLIFVIITNFLKIIFWVRIWKFDIGFVDIISTPAQKIQNCWRESIEFLKLRHFKRFLLSILEFKSNLILIWKQNDVIWFSIVHFRTLTFEINLKIFSNF